MFCLDDDDIGVEEAGGVVSLVQLRLLWEVGGRYSMYELVLACLCSLLWRRVSWCSTAWITSRLVIGLVKELIEILAMSHVITNGVSSTYYIAWGGRRVDSKIMCHQMQMTCCTLAE